MPWRGMVEGTCAPDYSGGSGLSPGAQDQPGQRSETASQSKNKKAVDFAMNISTVPSWCLKAILFCFILRSHQQFHYIPEKSPESARNVPFCRDHLPSEVNLWDPHPLNYAFLSWLWSAQWKGLQGQVSHQQLYLLYFAVAMHGSVSLTLTLKTNDLLRWPINGLSVMEGSMKPFTPNHQKDMIQA